VTIMTARHPISIGVVKGAIVVMLSGSRGINRCGAIGWSA